MTNDADSTRSRIGGDESPIRYLFAGDRHWTVREIASSQYDRREARDLMFLSQDVVRRLHTFPRNWYLLDDDALYAVSLGS